MPQVGRCNLEEHSETHEISAYGLASIATLVCPTSRNDGKGTCLKHVEHFEFGNHGRNSEFASVY